MDIVYADGSIACMFRISSGILNVVMKMKGSKDVLSSIIKTTQMGQIGIRSVLNAPLSTSIKDALRMQLREYDAIEREALELAASRGWTVEQLDPAIRAMTNMMTRMRLSCGNSTSKAAAMMIQGNTKGIIKGYKNLNQFPPSDQRVVILSQKLLDCEKAGCQQMQGFL